MGFLCGYGLGGGGLWPGESRGPPPVRWREQVRWALGGAVGLPEEKWSWSPFALASGEQRRLALAAVLAMRPRLLLPG